MSILTNQTMKVANRTNFTNNSTVIGWALAYHCKTKDISYIFYFGVYESSKGYYTVFDLHTGLTFNKNIKGRLAAIEDAIIRLNKNDKTTLQVINKIETLTKNKNFNRLNQMYINKNIINKLIYKNNTYTVGFIPNTKKRVLMRGENINNIKIKGV